MFRYVSTILTEFNENFKIRLFTETITHITLILFTNVSALMYLKIFIYIVRAQIISHMSALQLQNVLRVCSVQVNVNKTTFLPFWPKKKTGYVGLNCI